jgi:hypothetical protein
MQFFWVRFVTPIAVPLAAVLGYQAMPDSGAVYAVPVDQAYSKLQMMELEPGLRSMIAASDDLGLSTSGTPNQSVIWTFTHEGKKVGEVRADLEPSGDSRTRVKVSFELAERGELKHHAAFVNQQELVSSFITINLQERIAAKLENRKFDESKVSSAMAEYALSNPAAMMKFGYDMSRAQYDPRLNGHDDSLRWKEEAAKRKAAAQVALTPEQQAAAAEAKMRAASAPMVDPSAGQSY